MALTAKEPQAFKNGRLGNVWSSVDYYFFIYFFVLFAIFILHSRESELYRYTLDGKSALAWELPFSRFYGSPVFHMKVGRPVKCLAQGHNKRTCRLFTDLFFIQLSLFTDLPKWWPEFILVCFNVNC